MEGYCYRFHFHTLYRDSSSMAADQARVAVQRHVRTAQVHPATGPAWEGMQIFNDGLCAEVWVAHDVVLRVLGQGVRGVRVMGPACEGAVCRCAMPRLKCVAGSAAV